MQGGECREQTKFYFMSLEQFEIIVIGIAFVVVLIGAVYLFIDLME